MAVHTFIAINNYWAFTQFTVMISYLIMGVSFCVFVNSLQKMKKLLCLWVIVLFFCAVDRIAGIGVVGSTGIMGDENDFALAMNVILPISFFLGREMVNWKKWFFMLASVLFVLANIKSASRGGFLGLAAVGLVCWIFSKHKLQALLVMAFVAVIGWNYATPEFKNEIMKIGVSSSEEDTGKDRVELWKCGWRAFLANPVLGVGQGNMPIVIGHYQYDDSGNSYWRKGLYARQIHSVYFTLIPELGTIGILLVYLMVKDSISKHLTINRFVNNIGSTRDSNLMRSINIALIVSMLSYFMTGIFLSAFYYPEFWNISTLIIALFYIATRLNNKASDNLAADVN
jgi:O-antigen ligase